MPELPEVETTIQGIAPHLVGKAVQGWQIRNARLRWPVPAEALQGLRGCVIEQVLRRGKYMLLRLGDKTVIWHLGMSGSMRIVGSDTPPGKHDHVELQLADGTILRYNDPRRFGAVLMTDAPWPCHKLLRHLGPEPVVTASLGPEAPIWQEDELMHLAKPCKRAIKTVLMDSHVVVGVGNIYANEALFLAGIRPTRNASAISRKRYAVLQRSVQEVLRRAIDQGGTTLKDFTQADGKPGYFTQELSVYGRAGAPCSRCSSPVQRIEWQGRATYFCPKCQF